jgi:aryl-alcohol dehydrogenase-like predicted oxidoreductase
MTATLGLGLAALGRPAYITLGRAGDLGPLPSRTIDLMRDRTWELLDAAWAAGVRHVDAARSYGYAERFLGEWLADDVSRRAALTIGSKWGYRYVAKWRTDVEVHEVKDHALSAFDEQWPLTLEALGAAPDFYLIHSLTPESPALSDDALLDRLRSIAQQGVRVGMSTSGPRQGEVLDAALALDATPFSAVQSTINLLEHSAAPALARAHDAGWFVAAKEVFANGRLTGSGSTASAVADCAGLPPDSAALGWALSQPFIDVALTGAVTDAQLAANLATQPLSAEQIGALAALVEPPEQYWSTRSALPWA